MGSGELVHGLGRIRKIKKNEWEEEEKEMKRKYLKTI